jgi:hypothetical protein
MGPQTCNDRVDNDADQLIDCADPDCAQFQPCFAAVPALSSRMLVLLAAALMLVGLLRSISTRRG